MFKITKNKSYRLNFILDDLHYSLNTYDDGCERYVGLTCKEGNFSCVVKYDSYVHYVLIPFMKEWHRGSTYAQQYDLAKLEDFLRSIIQGRASFHATI